MKHTKTYLHNKSANLVTVLECPTCGTKFQKKNRQQVFCRTKPGTFCKDSYWNKVDPTKRNNTTRLSPARKQFLEQRTDVDDDQSWDANKNNL